jgi:threonine dehydrogenase-like Zn-dependent dehydrogenase
MKSRQTDERGARLIFEAGARVRMEDIPVPRLPGPYGIVLRSEHSLVNSGTDLAKLKQLETVADPTAPHSIVPTGVVMGQVIEAGSAVGAIYPVIAPGSWIVAKAPHASHLQLNVLTDDLVAFGEDRPPLHFLLARYANVAASGMCSLGGLDGGSVAVIGLGPLGHICMRLLGHQGQNRLFGIDRHAYRRAALANAHPGSWTLRDRLPETETFDAIVLAAPLGPDPDQYLERLRPRGRLILLAAPGAAATIDLADAFSRSLSIDAFHERETGLIQWGCSAEGRVETPVAAGIRVLSQLKANLKWPLDYFVYPDRMKKQFYSDLCKKNGRVFLILSWCD